MYLTPKEDLAIKNYLFFYLKASFYDNVIFLNIMIIRIFWPLEYVCEGSVHEFIHFSRESTEDLSLSM